MPLVSHARARDDARRVARALFFFPNILHIFLFIDVVFGTVLINTVVVTTAARAATSRPALRSYTSARLTASTRSEALRRACKALRRL